MNKTHLNGLPKGLLVSSKQVICLGLMTSRIFPLIGSSFAWYSATLVRYCMDDILLYGWYIIIWMIYYCINYILLFGWYIIVWMIYCTAWTFYGNVWVLHGVPFYSDFENIALPTECGLSKTKYRKKVWCQVERFDLKNLLASLFARLGAPKLKLHLVRLKSERLSALTRVAVFQTNETSVMSCKVHGEFLSFHRWTLS